MIDLILDLACTLPRQFMSSTDFHQDANIYVNWKELLNEI